MLVKLFGLTLSLGVAGTSLAMATLGRRWQPIEAAAYGGERLPQWFWLGTAGALASYLATLASFLQGPKSWAGWTLMVLIPLGWTAKAALVTFNPGGRRAVSSLAGDRAWRRVALARLSVALVLAVLTKLA
jgi:hypothetical protein